jgi:hypothetical protein
MKYYKISEEVRNAFLVFLSEQPYKNVAQGIAVLQQLEELPEEEPSAEKQI